MSFWLLLGSEYISICSLVFCYLKMIQVPEVNPSTGNKLCRRFYTTGQCGYGDACCFDHVNGTTGVLVKRGSGKTPMKAGGGQMVQFVPAGQVPQQQQQLLSKTPNSPDRNQ